MTTSSPMPQTLLFSAFFLLFVSTLSIPISITVPSISASPDVLPTSGSTVSVRYSGSAGGDTVLAVFSPPDAEVFIGFYDDLGEEGTITLPLLNMRADYAFALLPDASASRDDALAWSNTVSFEHGDDEPMQGHLALTQDPSVVSLMWVSGSDGTPTVWWRSRGEPAFKHSATGTSSTYTAADMCGEPANTTAAFRDPGRIHYVEMTNLHPSVMYEYTFGTVREEGTATVWSETFAFVTPPAAGGPVNVLAYGDTGVKFPFKTVQSQYPESQKTTAKMLERIDLTPTTAVLHIGDLSYARGWAYQWEHFFDQFQPLMARVPYMVCIGNHEEDYLEQKFKPEWSNYGADSGGECGVPYNKRFAMPATPSKNAPQVNNLWFSFDHGAVHFLLMSTEHDFLPGSEQYQFIVSDLASVNRSVTPWVVFSGHRPMYSSSSLGSAVEWTEHFRAALEPVLIEHHVELCLWGHVHMYERTCALNNFVCADDDNEGPVHMVIGMAGQDYQVPWQDTGSKYHSPMPDWIVFRSGTFGYTNIAANATHLTVDYFDNVRNEVHDTVSLHK